MACTEIYKEHIMYTFHGFCKVVIRNASITAWRDQQRRHKREISLEYLTEEKFYPLGTTDEYFTAPYEEYPITICGQTVILTNGKLAVALRSLPEKNQEIIFLNFFGNYRQWEIGEMYGRCRSTTGYQIHRTLKLLRKEMEVLSHGEIEIWNGISAMIFSVLSGEIYLKLNRRWLHSYLFIAMGYLL